MIVQRWDRNSGDVNALMDEWTYLERNNSKWRYKKQGLEVANNKEKLTVNCSRYGLSMFKDEILANQYKEEIEVGQLKRRRGTSKITLRAGIQRI